MRYWISSYPQYQLENYEIICFDKKINMTLTLRRRGIDWYHFYLNQSIGRRLANKTRRIRYWKGLVT